MEKTKMKKNIVPHVKCPFCHSGNTNRTQSIVSEINDKKYDLHECNSCKIQFFTPLKFENVYENEKDKSYIPFHKGRTELPSWTIKISNTLKKLGINPKEKTILDVGAGDAINFQMLSGEFGVGPDKYYALELDKKSLASAKKRGVKNIINQYFDKSILKTKKRFDIVIASEVLEHQVNPKEFLETCMAMLAKDGVLIITVPNRERRFFKHRSVPEDCPPHHFLRFSKDFFRKNFGRELMLLDHYGYGLRNLTDSAKAMTNKKYAAYAAIPVVLAMRVVDIPRGVGIIAVMKK